MTREPKTLVFCTSHVAGPREWELRYRRWLRHHAALPWGAALVCMIDDGSPWLPDAAAVQLVSADAPLPPPAGGPLMLRFAHRLGRSAVTDYPGWWRSFLFSVVVARHYGCERIVHVESDAFVLTRRTVDFIRGCESGWTAFWCPRWRFPETAIQVVCQDQFDAMERIRAGGWEVFRGRQAEQVLPFTRVVREPHGNRYGEFRRNIPGFADFAVQVRPDQRVWFK